MRVKVEGGMEIVGWSYEGLKHGFGIEARVANE